MPKNITNESRPLEAALKAVDRLAKEEVLFSEKSFSEIKKPSKESSAIKFILLTNCFTSEENITYH